MLRTSSVILGFLLLGLCAPLSGFAATLSVEPTAGSYVVGSTFNVSLFLDTEKESVNAIEAYLSFPPDKLQLVSPSTGFSVITTWAQQPSFNNQNGTISLQGVVPTGIYATKGLVTTLTFRVKSVGQAIVKFLDQSRVLLNDGKGTNDLRATSNGIFHLILPPPSGPLVSSDTHPEQNKWYANPDASFYWGTDAAVEGYSYVLNNIPLDLPDDISEGTRTSVTYNDLGDGVRYFHIKALRNGAWGSTTHFALKTDATIPAEFPIEIIPAARTVRRQPAIQFGTTDPSSGIERYELRIISLENTADHAGDQSLFIEAKSPYIPQELEFGSYDVIVRAYDFAGNYREETQPLKIVALRFEFVSEEGIMVINRFTISWFWLSIFSFLVVVGLGYLGWHLKHLHHNIDWQNKESELPDSLKDQLRELQKYKEKYGKTLMALLVLGTLFANLHAANAQSAKVMPPLITTLSKNISNEEIFYVGGKTKSASTDVVIYLQNLQTGEATTQDVVSDEQGDWFYRHSGFLSSGDYLLWAQSRLGNEVSPPGPQEQMTVRATALQFGANRLSYETIYLFSTLFLLLTTLGLGGYVAYHGLHARRKYRTFSARVERTEKILQEEFVALERDIVEELQLLKKSKAGGDVSTEALMKEQQILSDIEAIRRHIAIGERELGDI